MTRALDIAPDLSLALRALPPFHDGVWRRGVDTIDPAIGFVAYFRAAFDIIRCVRRGWLERGSRPGNWFRITRAGRAQLSIATALREDLRAAVREHGGTIELAPADMTPETAARRGFGLGSAIGCCIALVVAVAELLTTANPAGFLVAAVVMCGCVVLLTDFAVGDRSGEVD